MSNETLSEIEQMLFAGNKSDTNPPIEKPFSFKNHLNADDFNQTPKFHLDETKNDEPEEQYTTPQYFNEQQQTPYFNEQQHFEEPPAFEDHYTMKEQSIDKIKYAFLRLELKRDPEVAEVLMALELDPYSLTPVEVSTILKCSLNLKEAKFKTNGNLKIIHLFLSVVELGLIQADPENAQEIKTEINDIKDNIIFCDQSRLVFDCLETDIEPATPFQKALQGIMVPVLNMCLRKLPRYINKFKDTLENIGRKRKADE